MAGGVEEAQQLMEMAEETLQAAKTLAREGLYRDSLSRAYYAMFYAAKAAVVSDGGRVSKHSAVISFFGHHLANPGRVPRHLHGLIIAAFDNRQLADYRTGWHPTEEEAHRRIVEAEEFVFEIGRFLRQRSS